MRRSGAAARPNEVRIIGGRWRSRRIHFPARADLRPTPDRVRETLFNWLGQDLSGFVCLDLFAGSGALGFEAASRGARAVVMIEKDREAHAALVRNREQLGASQVEALRSDALEFVRSDARQYDVIFLDPPFASSGWETLLPAVASRLASGGWVYCEAGESPAWPAGWTVRKQGRAGQVSFQLLQTEPQ